MDWNKLLNIIIISLLFTLVFQYLFGAKQVAQVPLSTVYLKVDGDSILPNPPKIHIINGSQSGAIINTCRDITISYESTRITDIEQTAPSFCQTISIPAGSGTLLPLDSLVAPIFSRPQLTGAYIVKLSIGWEDKIVNFTHSQPGIFRSLFRSFVYSPIYNLLVAIISILPWHTLGWAILIITIIIRLILLVPQHHMMLSQRKLQKIQPQIREIQKKYKDDQAKLGQEMLALYSREKVSPMGSCLPLIIQMPIMIGLYWVILGVDSTVNYSYLYSFFQDFQITSIDPHFLGIDLRSMGGVVGGVFAVILASMQYLQARLSFSYQAQQKEATPTLQQKKEDEKDTSETLPAFDPAMMQNMMLYFFPVMIAVSSYFFPLGVGLYWFIGTLFVIVQQWVVNRMTDQEKS